MPINADKPQLWKRDIATSVDLYNEWFVKFAPATFRKTRADTTDIVRKTLSSLNNLRSITPDALRRNPGVLPTLRMSTAPPIARDRLVGLSGVRPNLVSALEEGRLPARTP